MGGSPQDCAAPHRPPAEQLMHPPLARFGHVGLLRRAPFEHLVDAQLVQRFLVLLRDRPRRCSLLRRSSTTSTGSSSAISWIRRWISLR